jgi:hypothetical protein
VVYDVVSSSVHVLVQGAGHHNPFGFSKSIIDVTM